MSVEVRVQKLYDAKAIQASRLNGIEEEVDVFSRKKRSWIMAQVRSSDTSPEIKVRSMVHRLGCRFSLHGRNLPGRPDLVLRGRRTVIFVHGCFWHRHARCERATTPASNRRYWLPKFERTQRRDRANQRKLRSEGWNVVIVWECELSKPERLLKKLMRALGG